MNKFHPFERLSGLLAFLFSAFFYGAIAALIFFLLKTRPPKPAAFSSAPVTLSFAQIELQAAEPPPETKPPPTEVNVVTEKIVAQPEPEQPPPEPRPPEPQPVKVETKAQVTQQAAAPAAPPVDRNVLLTWVREQIEKEKYYPPAARNAGFEGRFRLRVIISADGKISEAAVLEGTGHSMLRRSLERITAGLVGRDSGRRLPEPVELPFDFEFRLN